MASGGAITYYCPGSLDGSTLLAIFIASLRAVSCAAAIVFAGLWMSRKGMLTHALSKGLSMFSVNLVRMGACGEQCRGAYVPR